MAASINSAKPATDASVPQLAGSTFDAEGLSNYANSLGAALPARLTPTDYALPTMSIPGSSDQSAAGMAENLYEHPEEVAASGRSINSGATEANTDAIDKVPGEVKAALPDLATGALDEIKDHTLKVGESLVEGVAAGGALTGVTYGAAAVAGLAFGAPVAAGTATVLGAGLVIGGIGYGAYELDKHVGSWLNDASAVENPTAFTSSQVNAAHDALQGVGAGAVDTGASILGGAAFGAGTLGLKAALAGDAVNSTAAAVDTTATGLALPPVDSDSVTPHLTGTTPEDGGQSISDVGGGGVSGVKPSAATPGSGVSNQPLDATQGNGNKVDQTADPTSTSSAGSDDPNGRTLSEAARKALAAANGPPDTGDPEDNWLYASQKSFARSATSSPERLSQVATNFGSYKPDLQLLALNNPATPSEALAFAAVKDPDPIGREIALANPSLKPQDLAVAQSLDTNQGIFNAAGDDGVVPLPEMTTRS